MHGTYTVTLNSGQVITDQDFGNFRKGSIHGTKFEDKNANGRRDEVHLLHGLEDNYDTTIPDVPAASPSPGLLQRLAGLPVKGFDDPTINRFFADSFENLPTWITGALARPE